MRYEVEPFGAHCLATNANCPDYCGSSPHAANFYGGTNMDEYDRLKAQKNKILTDQADVKERRIASLESQLKEREEEIKELVEVLDKARDRIESTCDLPDGIELRLVHDIENLLAQHAKRDVPK